jgi:hypothetical protein
VTSKPIMHGRDHRPGGADPMEIKRFLPVVFDGMGAALTTGIKGDVSIHLHGAVITGWRLLADQAGSIQIDIWKTDYAGFPPTVTNTIVASDPPKLTAAAKADDTTLTGWTTALAFGDTLRFHIDSVTSITRATLTLALIT